MKKIALSLTVCALFFASCGSEMDKLENVNQNNEALNFSPSIGKATRTAEFMNDSWKQGEQFMLHAYMLKSDAWTSYFTQELENTGTNSWELQGDPRFRVNYETKFITVFPQETEGNFVDKDVDFKTTFPSVLLRADKNGYLPDYIAAVSDVAKMETKVPLKFRHLLSQINVGIEGYRYVKVKIHSIKFRAVPTSATYHFHPGQNGEYGHWIAVNPVIFAPTLDYKFSDGNGFTTTGEASEGDYVLGDGGNFALGNTYKYVCADGKTRTKDECIADGIKLDNAMMMIPNAIYVTRPEIDVTFSATDMDNNPIADSQGKLMKTITIKPADFSIDWKQNYRYLYILKFNFEDDRFTFDVKVESWDNADGTVSSDELGKLD